MTKFGSAGPVAENAGRPRLDRGPWRAKAGILGLAIGATFLTFIAFPEHGPLSLLVGLASAFLAIGYVVARDLIGGPLEAETAAAPLKRTSRFPAQRGNEAKQGPVAPIALPSAQSAAGFLERFRQSLSLAESEAGTAAQELRARGVARFRFDGRRVWESTGSTAAPSGGDMAALKPNELAHYLNQRLAAPVSGRAGTGTVTLAPRPGSVAACSVLMSLDTVLDHVLAFGRGEAPRALLVGGASAAVDATFEAISIARALVVEGAQVVLVDLAHGPASVSGALGLPRAPGLAELSAGMAGFEDVVGIDAETPLQVIAAGNPGFAASGHGSERFAAIFEALTETYERVVLHADCAALHRLGPALRFEIPVVVGVLPAGASASGAEIDVGILSALGCSVLVEQGGTERRQRFLGWAAAI